MVVETCFLTLLSLSRDTVSSIGFIRQLRPGASVLGPIFCYFRQAIAADECRGKFQIKLVHRGASIPPEEQEFDEAGVPRVKEVHFAGTHAEMCVKPLLSDTVLF